MRWALMVAIMALKPGWGVHSDAHGGFQVRSQHRGRLLTPSHQRGPPLVPLCAPPQGVRQTIFAPTPTAKVHVWSFPELSSPRSPAGVWRL